LLQTQLTRGLGVLVLGAALQHAPPAGAGEFTINPIRMELGGQAKTGAFVIRNDGKQQLSFQLRGMSWTQDAAGQDQYEEASDLVFFPRILVVDSEKEAVVRVGVRQTVVPVEKTYRLFIEELPQPAAAAASAPKGAALTVLIRFGAPIFVKPVHPQDKLEIEHFELAGGTVRLTLRNSGNQHQLVEGINLKGFGAGAESLYATTLADRYLLAGTVKQYTAAIPKATCETLSSLVAEIKTDKSQVSGRIQAGRQMCQ
jgi:fimbrial chaperone protein